MGDTFAFSPRISLVGCSSYGQESGDLDRWPAPQERELFDSVDSDVEQGRDHVDAHPVGLRSSVVQIVVDDDRRRCLRVARAGKDLMSARVAPVDDDKGMTVEVERDQIHDRRAQDRRRFVPLQVRQIGGVAQEGAAVDVAGDVCADQCCALLDVRRWWHESPFQR